MTFESMSEAELWEIATPIMDNLMDGSKYLVDHVMIF
ncbi:hypothetical protein MOVI109754_15910 [Moritella viscosa]